MFLRSIVVRNVWLIICASYSLSIASDGLQALERRRDPVDSLRKKIQVRKRGKLTFSLTL